MTKKSHINLSRRERQIMDIIYQRSQASAGEVMENLPNPPSYSAVRALLRVLENKGYLKHKKAGARYIYMPTQPRHNAGKSALKRVLQTFYDNSVEKTVVALLDISDSEFSDEELDRLAQLIDQARKGGH